MTSAVCRARPGRGHEHGARGTHNSGRLQSASGADAARGAAMNATKPSTIALRLDSIAHLFDPLDPFPTPSRDLSRSAEDFIVGWARELPRRVRPRLVLHVRQETALDEDAVKQAIRTYFTSRAARMKGDIEELFRIGRRSLLIGLAVLAACVTISQIAGQTLGHAGLARFLSEGLIILGWVANWRPIEIFLYEWWPIQQRRGLFERLAAAEIEIDRP